MARPQLRAVLELEQEYGLEQEQQYRLEAPGAGAIVWAREQYNRSTGWIKAIQPGNFGPAGGKCCQFIELIQ